MELLKNRTGKFIYSGRDECFLSAIAAGADGGIGTTFNLIVKKYIEIQKLYKQGDMAGALKVQHEANEITEILCQCGIFAATKYLLEKKGIHAGIARKPFAALTDEKRGLLDSIVDKI
jgi:N-acetylneuraminate lyase